MRFLYKMSGAILIFWRKHWNYVEEKMFRTLFHYSRIKAKCPEWKSVNSKPLWNHFLWVEFDSRHIFYVVHQKESFQFVCQLMFRLHFHQVLIVYCQNTSQHLLSVKALFVYMHMFVNIFFGGNFDHDAIHDTYSWPKANVSVKNKFSYIWYSCGFRFWLLCANSIQCQWQVNCTCWQYIFLIIKIELETITFFERYDNTQSYIIR